MSDHDAELVALIDNELDEGSKTALLARLAADEGLRQRYEELRRTTAPLAASFDGLLEQAPLAHLRTTLPADQPIRQPRTRFARFAFRELAAGFVIGALAVGAALWAASSFGLFDGREDWRTAIAEYTHLYTNETFGPLKPDAAQQTAELKAVGAMVGASLTPENIALPDLRFTSAFMLSYGGSPMGVIAYVDPTGRAGPALYPRQRRARLAYRIRAARRFVASLVVAQRTQPSGHWPRSRGAGRCSGADAGETRLTLGCSFGLAPTGSVISTQPLHSPTNLCSASRFHHRPTCHPCFPTPW